MYLIHKVKKKFIRRDSHWKYSFSVHLPNFVVASLDFSAWLWIFYSFHGVAHRLAPPGVPSLCIANKLASPNSASVS